MSMHIGLMNTCIHFGLNSLKGIREKFENKITFFSENTKELKNIYMKKMTFLKITVWRN